MSPEERERLVRVETELNHVKTTLDSVEGKVDELLVAANMGRGAWHFVIRIGGTLVAFAIFADWIVGKLQWMMHK